jgi:hypothetical protein
VAKIEVQAEAHEVKWEQKGQRKDKKENSTFIVCLPPLYEWINIYNCDVIP